jgi:iron complex transport system ATP-binding protein
MVSKVVNAAIEIKNFSYAVGNKTILHNITFSVAEGEYLTIIGPNGAGKTTLLRCIDKIAKGGSGSIKVFGKNTNEYRQTELAKIIAYVPQSDGRQFPFTVHEFVMMGRYPHLSPFSSVEKRDEDAVSCAMEQTGVSEFRERIIGTLSSGERQKVFIAAALAQEAKALLLDEPTTFLDYKHQSEIQKLLKRINRKSGWTIISVTHDINSAALASDKIIAIKNGEVVFSGKPEEAMKNEVLDNVYGRHFVFANHPSTGQAMIMPDEV